MKNSLTKSQTEVWKWVAGYEGFYKVSNFGRVKSVVRKVQNRSRVMLLDGKILRQSKNNSRNGYYLVFLSKGGKVKNKYVHTLMLESFVGSRPFKFEARHLDDNKSNNILANLCWGSSAENKCDAKRNGKARKAKGEENGRSKITCKTVKIIRKLHKRGMSNRSISNKIGVSCKIVRDVVTYRTWKHVSVKKEIK